MRSAPRTTSPRRWKRSERWSLCRNANPVRCSTEATAWWPTSRRRRSSGTLSSVRVLVLGEAREWVSVVDVAGRGRLLVFGNLHDHHPAALRAFVDGDDPEQ